MKTRYKKVLRDLTGNLSKNLMLVIAIAAGVFGIGTLLGGYSVIKREMKDNYLNAIPASATIEVEEDLPAELMDSIENLLGIMIAERHATISSRMKIDDQWRPLLLFVIDDFKGKQTNKIANISGENEPPLGSMLVERSSFAMLTSQQDGIVVKTPYSDAKKVKISGIVHDPTLAPAWQEEGGYGYITLSTLHWLGESQGFNQVRLLVEDQHHSQQDITERAIMVANLLESKGYQVHEIQIPPPGRHPHQSQMNAVMTIFILFVFLILILGSILVATSVATFMVKQVRQIGIMKTVGARSSQVMKLYFLMILAICLTALLFSIPLSRLAATGFYEQIALLLNLEIRNGTIEGWVPVVQIATGILIPLIFAAIPVVKGARISVRQALDNYGVSPKERSSGGWILKVSQLFVVNEILLLSVRNVFRHRDRLLMTLGLLAAGGAMFLTALNISKAWNSNLDRIYTQRLYDIEVRLNAAVMEDSIFSVLKGMPKVNSVEGWSQISTLFVDETFYEITHTYPDQGHGSFTMQGVPVPTKLVVPEIVEGRWLSKDDSNTVVLNQLARTLGPERKIGDMINLSMHGKSTEWEIVGFTEDVGSPATAYVPLINFQKIMENSGKVNLVRVSYSDRSRENISELTPLLEKTLEQADISIKGVVPVWLLHNAVASHIQVMVNSLLAVAALMGLVGILGLTSTTSMNIMERTIEIGIMRVIGATPGKVRQLVISEALLIGILSIILAFVISLFLSVHMGVFIGNLAFKTPLSLTVSLSAFIGWIAIILIGSYIAAYLPARKANKITAKEALVYE